MAYKRRFSDDDVKLMEQDAEAAGRLTDAERKMALSRNFDNRRNNQIADLTAAAHERRMASRARFIEGNPGAVSPQERAGVMEWQHNQGLTGRERALQQHEMNMLKQRGANDKAVAFEKRMGMENQGLGVGRLKHGYTDENGNYHEGSEERIAREQGQNALSLAEKEWAGKKEIAGIEAGVKKHEIDTRHKGILDTNDANVEIEDRRQKGALDVEKERGKSAAEIARDNRLAAAAEAERARQEKNNQAQEERILEMMKTIEKNPDNRNLTTQEKRAKALEMLGINGGLSQFRK